MDDGRDALHRGGQRGWIGDIAGGDFKIKSLQSSRIALISHQNANIAPPLQQQTCYVIAHQAGGTSDQYAGLLVADSDRG